MVAIMSDSTFVFITIHLVRAIGIVTLVLDVCAWYVIIIHSTPPMAQYKWVLLGISVS